MTMTADGGGNKERRGFASMSPEKQREIASKGGRAAHEKGTAHAWNADEAPEAGRTGGYASHTGGRKRPHRELVSRPPNQKREHPYVVPPLSSYLNIYYYRLLVSIFAPTFNVST